MLCGQGKENVLGSGGCYTGFGSLRAQLHIDILCESGKAGVGTLQGLPHLQEFRGHFRMYVESLALLQECIPFKHRSNNRRGDLSLCGPFHKHFRSNFKCHILPLNN